MKRMLNERTAFREEMIAGYAGAYGRYLRRVPDASGVMARGAPRAGKVAVVVGGGSGHYPAFYGLVGRGMADGAAIGDVFTSPSGEQCYRVARAVDGGAGVLFTFGNYSGDVMNFGMAETRLRAEGIETRTVLVTDDVLSAPVAETDRRRGIAGGFYVFKIAGASAARGDDLAMVEAMTRRANERVRTVGVAFGGCTIPGQDEPLFTVAPGQMEVGLGIHGEPGVRTTEQLPAREIARLMVDALIAEAPPDAGGQAAVLLNGLGSTKYEELFVLYQGIAPLLAAAGIDAYEPRIGEFVTALDMTGCSLSLFWLDDDLRTLHDATAATPAFTQIGQHGPDEIMVESVGTLSAVDTGSDVPETTEEPAGTPGRAGARARAAVVAASQAIEAAEDELGRLDAAAGDGDHGAGMARGFRAAVAAIGGGPATARQILVSAGTAFQDAAGGASGALVGGSLIAIGAALPAADERIDAPMVATALAAGLATIQRLGQAQPGDKTLVDTLEPFVRLFQERATTDSTARAWNAALPVAEAGMRATTEMVSKRGRASRLGERSRGFPDAGATSVYYILRAVGEALTDDD